MELRVLNRKTAKMEYIVIENHRTEFPDPILLKQGETVFIGEKSTN
jgi:hypothetical protein